MFTRVFGLPLAKSLEPLQRTDTETSLASAAALATACGIGQRSQALKKCHQTLFPPRGWGLGTRLERCKLLYRGTKVQWPRILSVYGLYILTGR